MTRSVRPNRLQIATRIHYVLLRELGQGIDVGNLIKRPLYARDVLLVCDAHPDHELSRLAQQFRAADAAPCAHADSTSTIAYRESQFAPDSSGFGVSRPMAVHVTTRSAPRTWFDRLIG